MPFLTYSSLPGSESLNADLLDIHLIKMNSHRGKNLGSERSVRKRSKQNRI